MTTRRSGRTLDRRGFTLVEMLIALVITGILAGGVVTLLLRQNQFYGKTDDVAFAEQSRRATVDLVSSELRLAAPGDLVAAAPDRVEFAFDLYRGVVCHLASGTVYFYAHDIVSNANVSSQRGVAFRNVGSATPDYQYDHSWDYTGPLTQAGSETDGEATNCQNNGGPTATPDNYQRFFAIGSWGASVGPPADGAVLRLFGTVEYRFATSGFGDGLGLFRNGQELTSPFAQGATFSYVLADGSEVSNPATLSDVRAVRIQATAVGEGANRYDVDRDLSYLIPIRNR